MGLQTDIIFVKALQADEELMAMLPAGDVYNTSIALPDADLDNAPLPYVIVTFDGLDNDGTTKDGYEGDMDKVTIGAEVAAEDRSQLGVIAGLVREAVREYFQDSLGGDDADRIPLDYQFSASAISYDQLKPCYWQQLKWQCDVRNESLDES